MTKINELPPLKKGFYLDFAQNLPVMPFLWQNQRFLCKSVGKYPHYF